MEGARDFRDQESAGTPDDNETTIDIGQTGRSQEAVQNANQPGRTGGARAVGEEPEKPLSDQLRRGQQEAKNVGGEIADVASELGALLQGEVQLAKAEIGQQVGKAVQSIVLAASAASFAMLMSIFLFVGVMLLLGEAFDLWIAAFITTGILLLLALIAGLIARQRLKQINLTPERTVESLKEDLEWARNQMKSSTR